VAVTRIKRDYQACRYGAALDALPSLLEWVRLLCDAAQGDDELRAYALAAEAYQVTGSLMIKQGDHGLAALAADRSVEAAARSQDPVVIDASARLATHSLMSGGHGRQAKDMASRAAVRMSADWGSPDAEALSVYGALLLRGAVAAALSEIRDDAATLL